MGTMLVGICVEDSVHSQAELQKVGKDCVASLLPVNSDTREIRYKYLVLKIVIKWINKKNTIFIQQFLK